MEWSQTIGTDARDVFDKVSTENGGLPQHKALTLEVVGQHRTFDSWSADENMIMMTKDHKESRKQLTRVLQNGEWSVQTDAMLVRAETDDSIETYAQDETYADFNASVSARVARRVSHCGQRSVARRVQHCGERTESFLWHCLAFHIFLLCLRTLRVSNSFFFTS